MTSDKPQQEGLLAALDAAPSQLRRDECGSWIIAGRRGAIHTWGDGKNWLAYVRCRSRQHWTFTKRRLAFMTLTQDGEEEGCLRLFRLPSPQEAVVIRDVMACGSGSITRPIRSNANGPRWRRQGWPVERRTRP